MSAGDPVPEGAAPAPSTGAASRRAGPLAWGFALLVLAAYVAARAHLLDAWFAP